MGPVGKITKLEVIMHAEGVPDPVRLEWEANKDFDLEVSFNYHRPHKAVPSEDGSTNNLEPTGEMRFELTAKSTKKENTSMETTVETGKVIENETGPNDKKSFVLQGWPTKKGDEPDLPLASLPFSHLVRDWCRAGKKVRVTYEVVD